MSPPNNSTAYDSTPETANRCNDNITNDEQQYEQEQQHQRKQQLDWEGPPAQGLYDPANEHEACGVGFIVAIDGKRSHKVSATSQNTPECSIQMNSFVFSRSYLCVFFLVFEPFLSLLQIFSRDRFSFSLEIAHFFS